MVATGRGSAGRADEAMPGLTRTFARWQHTDCHICGHPFLITRGNYQTFPINAKLVCEGCVTYADAYVDGYRDGKLAAATASTKLVRRRKAS